MGKAKYRFVRGQTLSVLNVNKLGDYQAISKMPHHEGLNVKSSNPHRYTKSLTDLIV